MYQTIHIISIRRDVRIGTFVNTFATIRSGLPDDKW